MFSRRPADMVPDPAVASPITHDADDDFVIVLARDNDASMIITGDKDLLQWVEHRPQIAHDRSLSNPTTNCRNTVDDMVRAAIV